MLLYLVPISLAFQCFIENSSHSPWSSPKTDVGCCSKCISVRRKEHRNLTPTPHSQLQQKWCQLTSIKKHTDLSNSQRCGFSSVVPLDYAAGSFLKYPSCLHYWKPHSQFQHLLYGNIVWLHPSPRDSWLLTSSVRLTRCSFQNRLNLTPVSFIPYLNLSTSYQNLMEQALN